ncbi:alpha/beta hydrolase [Streptomyces sp. NPDC003832]
MPRQETVTFDNGDGTTLTGNLFLPGHPAPAVVVAGTWTSVKELMADRYARKLAERGYAALSFDFTGFGASGGAPRDVENPERKVRDIRAALTFLAGRPEVDGDRLAALGICAAAMYMSDATAQDPRIRALALVAPWLHDAEVCAEAYGGDGAVAERIKAGLEARARYDETGEVDYVPVVSVTDERAAMPYDIDFYLNPERGAVPAWPNRFAVMAWADWLTYDAIELAPRISRPVLLVHSEDAAIPQGARRFHAALAGRKDILWTEGTQFDFYDRAPQVELALDTVTAHFDRSL